MYNPQLGNIPPSLNRMPKGLNSTVWGRFPYAIFFVISALVDSSRNISSNLCDGCDIEFVEAQPKIILSGLVSLKFLPSSFWSLPVLHFYTVLAWHGIVISYNIYKYVDRWAWLTGSWNSLELLSNKLKLNVHKYYKEYTKFVSIQVYTCFSTTQTQNQVSTMLVFVGWLLFCVNYTKLWVLEQLKTF